MSEGDLESLLRDIRDDIAIMASSSKEEFLERLDGKITSENREEMYAHFDGSKGLSEISDEVGTSREAVRLFMHDLREAGLIRVTEKSNKKIPEKLVDYK